MSTVEAHKLYISLTFLEKDAKKNFYHWTLYATGSEPPKGTKFHATDRGNKKNHLRYENAEVNNPMLSKSMTVCLEIGSEISAKAIHQSLLNVPLGSAKYIPKGETKWTCRVFLTAALEKLDKAGVIILPPGMNAKEIENVCYIRADHYQLRKKREGKIGPYVLNYPDWLNPGGSLPTDELSSYSQISHRQPTDTHATVPMDTERDHAESESYGPKPMQTDS